MMAIAHVVRAPLSVAMIAALTIALLVAGRAAAVETVLFAELTGAAEVDDGGTPGQGDPDGSGIASLTIDPELGEVCWYLEVSDIALASAAHIHVGDAGVNGAIVVTLGTPGADGIADGCDDGLDEATLQAIVDDPAGYYVNVHNPEFPGGALRGQLAAGVGGCELFASTEDQDPATSLTVEVGETVLIEGFFVGDADVTFVFTFDGVEVGEDTIPADGDGYAALEIVFEPGDEGTWNLLGFVEATECGADVDLTVEAATPAAPTTAPSATAAALPDTASRGPSDQPLGPLAAFLGAVGIGMAVFGARAARRSAG